MLEGDALVISETCSTVNILSPFLAIVQSYEQWSLENEASAWRGSKEINGILIKKACEHKNCPHTRCAKALRIGGIEI
jgi:hypothetical protein